MFQQQRSAIAIMDSEKNARDEVRILIGAEGGGKDDKEENQVGKPSSVKSEFKQFDTISDSFFTDHHYYYRRQKNFSPQAIEKISRECDILNQGLPDSILVRANKVKPDLLRAVIIGPEGTPHYDGLFFFDIYIPSKFPELPPKIRSFYVSGSWDHYIPHPCPWSPSTSTLLESLISIRRCQIFRGNSIYIDEMSTLVNKEDVFKFNWRTMVDVLNKPPKYFENFVARHFHDRAGMILTDCRGYISKRVNTIDDPVIRAPWQEEFDEMEKLYYKLVDAFQKNGSSLDHWSKLQIQFHGEPSVTMTEKIILCVLLCLVIMFFLYFVYCGVRETLDYFHKN